MAAAKSIRVWVSGAKGRMGSEVLRAVAQAEGLVLCGESDAGDALAAGLRAGAAEVCVDFTHPSCVFGNAQQILEAGVRPVIGTTGLEAAQVASLQAEAARRRLGGLIAPNFAIGAVLMMRFAQEAARHMERAEIVEIHHDGKAEAPSGTALRTAELITAARPEPVPPQVQSQALLAGALGAQHGQVRIHSVRLSGHVAHQEVIFGSAGESLRIRHDSIHRQSFMPGVLRAVRAVMEWQELKVGLEHALE